MVRGAELWMTSTWRDSTAQSAEQAGMEETVCVSRPLRTHSVSRPLRTRRSSIFTWFQFQVSAYNTSQISLVGIWVFESLWLEGFVGRTVKTKGGSHLLQVDSGYAFGVIASRSFLIWSSNSPFAQVKLKRSTHDMTMPMLGRTCEVALASRQWSRCHCCHPYLN